MAAAGHLEVAPQPEASARRRWSVLPRAALAAFVVLATLAAFVGFRAVAAAGQVVRTPGVPSAQATVGMAKSADPAPSDPGTSDSGMSDAGASDPGTSDAGTSDAGTSDAGTSGADTSSRPDPAVVVHVAGQVAEPGVVFLPRGSRVHEAIVAAGGAAPAADLTAVNLARVLTDGEQVYVPGVGEAPRAAAPGAGVAPESSELVDLNRASVDQLEELPGIGPVLAGRIAAWRAANGRFTMVEELAEVSGIGPALVANLRGLVTT